MIEIFYATIRGAGVFIVGFFTILIVGKVISYLSDNFPVILHLACALMTCYILGVFIS